MGEQKYIVSKTCSMINRSNVVLYSNNVEHSSVFCVVICCCVVTILYVQHNRSRRLSAQVQEQIIWCSFRKYTLELYDRPSAPLELKMRMLRAEVLEATLYGYVTWTPRACHYDTLR